MRFNVSSFSSSEELLLLEFLAFIREISFVPNLDPIANFTISSKCYVPSIIAVQGSRQIDPINDKDENTQGNTRPSDVASRVRLNKEIGHRSHGTVIRDSRRAGSFFYRGRTKEDDDRIAVCCITAPQI